MKRAFANIALALVSLVLSLAAAELLLRRLAPANPFDSSFPLYPHRTRHLHVATAQGQREVTQSTNRWGLRGDEPPADWSDWDTYVTVGGSTTNCYYIDDHKTWSYQLQKYLQKRNPRVWVGNAGMDGHSTRGHLLVMKEIVSRIRPKHVIFLVGVNDLGLSLTGDTERPFDKPANWRWRLFRASRLAQIVGQWALIAQGKAYHVTQARWEYRPKPIKNAMPLPPITVDLLPELPEFARNVVTLIREARAQGIQPIFLTQPILWEDTPRWQTIEGGFYWVRKARLHLSAASYAKLQNVYNQTLLDLCLREHAACFDVASAIPHSDLYYDDFVHLSDQGCALVARKVAEFIEKNDAGAP
jgi:lysophospholipase L1-like esterase